MENPAILKSWIFWRGTARSGPMAAPPALAATKAAEAAVRLFEDTKSAM